MSKDRLSEEDFEDITSHRESIQPLRNPRKSIYDAVICESDPEKRFAVQLDGDERIKMSIKLPDWFKVETPIGGYVPDWAILTARGKDNQERPYFIIETKSAGVGGHIT